MVRPRPPGRLGPAPPVRPPPPPVRPPTQLVPTPAGSRLAATAPISDRTSAFAAAADSDSASDASLVSRMSARTERNLLPRLLGSASQEGIATGDMVPICGPGREP